MEVREGIVQSVEIGFEGEVHRANYFVEYNVIHASLGEHVIATPVGNGPANDTVKALLLGHLLQQSRKMTSARRWAEVRHRQNAR